MPGFPHAVAFSSHIVCRKKGWLLPTEKFSIGFGFLPETTSILWGFFHSAQRTEPDGEPPQEHETAPKTPENDDSPPPKQPPMRTPPKLPRQKKAPPREGQGIEITEGIH